MCVCVCVCVCVMVTFVRYGLGDSSSNPERSYFHFT